MRRAQGICRSIEGQDGSRKRRRLWEEDLHLQLHSEGINLESSDDSAFESWSGLWGDEASNPKPVDVGGRDEDGLGEEEKHAMVLDDEIAVDFDNEDTKRLEESLFRHLRAENHTGLFAHCGVLRQMPNPGLILNTENIIRLPLGEIEVELIKDASEQERRTRRNPRLEFIHLTEPHVWDISPTSWRAENPVWVETVETVMRNIQHEFGGSEEIEVVPYKLFLQEPGGELPYPSPVASSQAFGFLDVTLPSRYRGGGVEFSYDDEKIVSPAQSSNYDCAISAWLFDANVAQTPLHCGHRVVLRYTFGYKDSSTQAIPSAAASSSHLSEMKETLLSWKARWNAEQPRGLATPLQTACSNEILSHHDLDWQDRLKVSLLKHVCQQSDFYLCLATIESRDTNTIVPDTDAHVPRKRRHGDSTWRKLSEEYGSTRSETDPILKQISDLDGSQPFRGLEVNLFRNHVLTLMGGGKETWLSETGKNDFDFKNGLLTTYSRTRTVVLIPRNKRLAVFFHEQITQRSDANKNWIVRQSIIDSLLKKYLEDPTTYDYTYQRLEVIEVCTPVLANISWTSPTNEYRQSTMDNVLKAVIKSKSDFLLELALPVLFSHPTFVQQAKELLLCEGYKWFNDRLLQSFEGLGIGNFVCRFKIIETMNTYLCEDLWLNRTLQTFISGTTLSTSEDGECLGLVANARKVDGTFNRKISEALIAHSSVLPVMLGFCSTSTSVEMKQEALAAASLHLSLQHSSPGQRSINSPQIDKAKELASNILNITMVIINAEKLELRSFLEDAIFRLSHEASDTSAPILEGIYIPFLKLLAREMRSAESALETLPAIRNMYCVVLNSYIECIPPEPPAPLNWSRPPLICLAPECRICKALNIFLKNSTKAVFELTWSDTEELGHVNEQIRQYVPTGVILSNFGGPTTRIEKTNKPYDDILQAWKTRCQQVKENIREIETLKIILAVGDYERIVSLNRIESDGDLNTSTRHQAPRGKAVKKLPWDGVRLISDVEFCILAKGKNSADVISLLKTGRTTSTPMCQHQEELKEMAAKAQLKFNPFPLIGIYTGKEKSGQTKPTSSEAIQQEAMSTPPTKSVSRPVTGQHVIDAVPYSSPKTPKRPSNVPIRKTSTLHAKTSLAELSSPDEPHKHSGNIVNASSPGTFKNLIPSRVSLIEGNMKSIPYVVLPATLPWSTNTQATSSISKSKDLPTNRQMPVQSPLTVIDSSPILKPPSPISPTQGILPDQKTPRSNISPLTPPPTSHLIRDQKGLPQHSKPTFKEYPPIRPPSKTNFKEYPPILPPPSIFKPKVKVNPAPVTSNRIVKSKTKPPKRTTRASTAANTGLCSEGRKTRSKRLKR